jgi:hypothetical protein
VPKHRCAADLAPRNLLFPRWLPGTGQHLITAGSLVNDRFWCSADRQTSLAWFLGAGIGLVAGG